MPPAPSASVVPENVQAVVRRQYREAFSLHLLFHFGPDVDQSRAFLAGVVPKVTFDSTPTAPLLLNVGVTHGGLAALGVPAAVLEQFPQELADGPVASVLGDYGASAPPHWWNARFTTSEIHLAIHLFSDDEAAIRAEAEAVRAAAASAGVTELKPARDHGPLAGRHLGGGRVHFGYRDGITQPDIGWDDATRRPEQLDFRRFLLGYATEDAMSSPHELPPESAAADPARGRAAADATALVRDGTYCVLRWMYQDAAAFNRFLTVQSAALFPTLPPAEASELLAAKLLGRWRDGTPLVLSPDSADPALCRADGFDYADDAAGTRCPLAAHIRVSNPRGGAVFSSEPVHRPRVIRRGTPYGPEIATGATADDGADRGLIGLFLTASIRSEFYTLTHWMQKNDFSSSFGPNFRTQDPFANRAVPGASPTFRVPGAGEVELPNFVRTQGTAFFLIPGRPALRRLAGSG